MVSNEDITVLEDLFWITLSIGDESRIPVFRAALESRNRFVRLLALRFVFYIGSSKVLGELRPLLEDRSDYEPATGLRVCDRAAEVVCHLSNGAVVRLAGLPESRRNLIVEGCKSNLDGRGKGKGKSRKPR